MPKQTRLEDMFVKGIVVGISVKSPCTDGIIRLTLENRKDGSELEIKVRACSDPKVPRSIELGDEISWRIIGPQSRVTWRLREKKYNNHCGWHLDRVW